MSYPVALFPSTFLSYGLFPFLLWMFWRMELLQKEKAAYCINLYTHLSILANGFSTVYPHPGRQFYFWAFLLARSLIPLSPSQVFYANFGCFSWSLPECDSRTHSLGIYRYLLRQAGTGNDDS